MLYHALRLLALAGALSGCGQDAANQPAARRDRTDAAQVTDDAGRVVEIAAPARRVVSLVPAVTDAVLALAAADRLIARTRFDTDPRIAHLPTTGNALMPSVEWLAALEPDLVIAWRDVGSRSLIRQLERLGIPVYAAHTESVGDALRVIRALGVLFGTRARADSLAGSIERELQAIRAAVAGAKRVRVAYLVGLEPPIIAGPETFIHELIEIAGGENVFADVRALWPQVSLEQLIQRAPAALVVAQATATDPRRPLSRTPGWRELPAVQRARVLVADPSVFNRPGPGLPRAAQLLARFLHPGAAR